MSKSSLPVHGYVAQSDKAVAMVNANKESEERILRVLDELGGEYSPLPVDKRWLALARTHIEQGFMALNRSIFQPKRVELPDA